MKEPVAPQPAPLSLTVDAQVDDSFVGEVDLQLLTRVIERALEREGVRGAVEVSLVVSDDLTLRQLNSTYRGVDVTTDVLSFPLQEPDKRGQAEHAFVVPPDDTLRLGDVVISYPRAKEQAVRYGHSLARETAYLTVHGVLHLLGYDHEEEADRSVMRAKEEAALSGEQGLERMEA